MAGAIVWGHALAALLFGMLAPAIWRGLAPGPARTALAVALPLTALWALAVAGLGSRDVAAGMAEAARDLAWLAVLALTARSTGAGRRASPLYVVVAAVMLLAGGLALAEPQASGAMHVRQGLRLLSMCGALLLVHHLSSAARSRGDVRLLTVALAGLWGGDLLAGGAAWALPQDGDALVALRGGMALAVALLVAVAAQHPAGVPGLSRTAAWRLIAGVAVLLYAGATALLATLAQSAFGANGRIAETAIVFGATAALLTLASTPQLRAWARVKLAKHLFSHRYDYRVEWQRFAATLGAPGAEPLATRVVRAVANLTESPAGLLLVEDDGVLTSAAAWNWPDAPPVADMALARHIADGRIVALDALAPGERTAIPPALAASADAWVLVPLIHGETLAGAILLARPPVARTLDWEDLDLLRVASRQAASYLAEESACAALAEEARFGEFNRRFAFLLHDIKNVASQISLVARNAERHADNPAFRADMVATLRDGADRMATLLARLGEPDASRPEPSGAIDVAALVRRIAAARRAQHAVEVSVEDTSLADAQPARLDQVLGHLVQNAIDASPADRPVALVVRRQRDRVAIDVIDDGAGMTAAFVRDELFRPFASTKPGGFGIGAYEARQLVRRMGGEIAVDSRPGGGTCFTVLLPMAAALEHVA